MGDMEQWLTDNWFNLLNTLGIVGSLWFTGCFTPFRNKTRRVANLLTITANYREVWKEYLEFPELARVIQTEVDVAKHPVTPAEEFFVNMIISHISSVYEALKMNW